jgi:hypothetical protein
VIWAGSLSHGVPTGRFSISSPYQRVLICPRGVADRSVRLLSIEPETSGTESVAFDDECEQRKKFDTRWPVQSSPLINSVASRSRTALKTFDRVGAPNGCPGANETSRTSQGNSTFCRTDSTRRPVLQPAMRAQRSRKSDCTSRGVDKTNHTHVLAATTPSRLRPSARNRR